MIEQTFYTIGDDFEAVCRPDTSCPPFIIADAANNRIVEGANLDLPEGYDVIELNLLASIADRDYVPFKIHEQRGRDLAYIGRQLLILDDKNHIAPPFDSLEKQLIQQLLSQVGISQPNPEVSQKR